MLAEHIESYAFSLTDVFHPELPLVATVVGETDSTLDASDEVNNWGVVWAEAMLIPSVVYTGNSVASVSTFNDSGTNLHREQETQPLQNSLGNQEQSIQEFHENSANGSLEHNVKEYISDYLSMPSLRNLGIIFGLPLALVAVLTTFTLELAGSIVYLLAIGFWFASSILPLSSTGPLLWVVYFVFLLLSAVFMILDSLLLVLSVGLAELFAGLCGALTFLVGGVISAIGWHRYIRRLCHLCRWAWRKSQGKLTPNRSFPLVPTNKERSITSVRSATSENSHDNNIEITQISNQQRGVLRIYEHDPYDVTDSWNTLSISETQLSTPPTSGPH